MAVSFDLIWGKAFATNFEEIGNADSSIITATQQINSAPKPIATAQPKSLKGIWDIQQMLDPCIDLKDDLDREIETWALGSVFKTVHQGANNVSVMQP